MLFPARTSALTFWNLPTPRRQNRFCLLQSLFVPFFCCFLSQSLLYFKQQIAICQSLRCGTALYLTGLGVSPNYITRTAPTHSCTYDTIYAEKHRIIYVILNYFRTFHRLVRPWLVYTRPSMRQRYCCGVKALTSLSYRGHWKLQDSSRLYSSTRTVSLPVQLLDAIQASTAEHERGVSEWIQVELLLGQRRHTVYPTAQVGVAAGDVHPVRSGEIAQHDFRSAALFPR